MVGSKWIVRVLRRGEVLIAPDLLADTSLLIVTMTCLVNNFRSTSRSDMTFSLVGEVWLKGTCISKRVRVGIRSDVVKEQS